MPARIPVRNGYISEGRHTLDGKDHSIGCASQDIDRKNFRRILRQAVQPDQARRHGESDVCQQDLSDRRVCHDGGVADENEVGALGRGEVVIELIEDAAQSENNIQARTGEHVSEDPPFCMKEQKVQRAKSRATYR